MGNIKSVRSPNYNFIFDKATGLFCRWGKTKDDDPQFSFFGPELLDIEVSTICSGIGKPCSFCYKSNGPKGENMSLDTFKQVLSKFDLNVLTQIAFGIGDISANPDLFPMFRHCRENGIIPNVTINGYQMTDEQADILVESCGAIAVSNYDRDLCYNTVQRLTSRGLKQTNIHMLLSEDTLDHCYDLIDDRLSDPRLSKLNAIVFLHMKPKGRACHCGPITSRDKYQRLIDHALTNGVSIGFDSCGANMFARTIKDHPDAKRLMQFVEPCESGLFSAYIDVSGRYWPCSFSEGVEGIESMDVLTCKSFLEIWNHDSTRAWKDRLLSCNRNCPLYEI